jgi:hypothetical protein
VVPCTRACRDWLDAQAAKSSAAEVVEAEGPKKKKQRRRPVIQFQEGATAQESVESMLASKNLKSRVNEDMLNQFFECASQLVRAPRTVRVANFKQSIAASSTILCAVAGPLIGSVRAQSSLKRMMLSRLSNRRQWRSTSGKNRNSSLINRTCALTSTRLRCCASKRRRRRYRGCSTSRLERQRNERRDRLGWGGCHSCGNLYLEGGHALRGGYD